SVMNPLLLDAVVRESGCVRRRQDRAWRAGWWCGRAAAVARGPVGRPGAQVPSPARGAALRLERRSVSSMARTRSFYLVPTGPGVGLTSVCLGLVHALQREGVQVGFIKPIRQPGDDGAPERSTEFVRRSTNIEPGEPLAFAEAEARLAAGKQSELLQEVVGRYQRAAQGADVVIVEGLAATADHPSLDALN